MKTLPMAHQAEALDLMDGREHFALFCEQGTGKTWMVLADTEREYSRGHIDGLLVVAPKGVDDNWIHVEVPEHLEVPHIASVYRSGASLRQQRQIDAVFRPREHGEVPPLRILAMNYEALTTNKGYDTAKRFLLSVRATMMLDESRRIKNVKALRSKRVMSLRSYAVRRRIGTGTPVAGAPIDVFGQMEFLETGLLGTTSYRAFVAEYADLVDDNSPLMRHIQQRIGARGRFAKPQIIATNPDGTPRWRNLDKLHELIKPHSYRVLKRDCLDLPDKIYQTRFFELSPKIRRAYDTLASELRLELDDDNVISTQRLSAQLKLQQITSGFVYVSKGEPHHFADDEKRRMALLGEVIEDLPVGSSFIVFARFREEIRLITALLNTYRIPFVEYHGDTKDADRITARNAFQSRAVRAFVSQPRCGGIGLTLTAAETVVYYSNSFDYEERIQSEDRAHRKGTVKNVVYIDLVAKDTVDEDIVRAQRRKEGISGAVLGDFRIGA